MMSKIPFHRATVPSDAGRIVELVFEDFGSQIKIHGVRRFPLEKQELLSLADPRMYRSMSRAAVLLAQVCLETKGVLEPFISRNPFGVGVYCALEKGPVDSATARAVAHAPPDQYAATFRRHWPPKQTLCHLSSVATAHVGILLQVMGPLHTFTHSSHGCLHAVEQAESDLAARLIDAALVCSAFSLEDPLVNSRIRRELPSDVDLSEGAAAIVIVRNDDIISWHRVLGARKIKNTYYGVAHSLVDFAMRMESGVVSLV